MGREVKKSQECNVGELQDLVTFSVYKIFFVCLLKLLTGKRQTKPWPVSTIELQPSQQINKYFKL